MKQSLKTVRERRERIFKRLLDEKEVYVDDLANDLCVSKITIRRDLAFFEEKKYIQRFHTGARLSSFTSSDSPNKIIEKLKHSIAKKAADYINSGDIIFINSSSTALLVLEYLGSKQVTIITNNPKAYDYAYHTNLNIIISGGLLAKNNKGVLVGDLCLKGVSSYKVSKAILGCSALSIKDGMTTSFFDEVAINQRMYENAKMTIILADHTKIGHAASYTSLSFDKLKTIITDERISKDAYNELCKRANKSIILASLC